MNLWFPFCKNDLSRAEEWLQWCAELGLSKHTIVLHPAMELKGCPPRVQELARKAFETVLIEPDREGHVGWPQGPNSCFRQAAWYFFMKKEDWIYMESDCWPTCSGWLDQIASEWEQAKQAGKYFMGDLVPGGNGYGEHMSGNAVWTWRMPEFSAKMMTAENGAFDIVEPGPIVANMHRTQLIQDVFCFPAGVVPTFPNMESLSIINPKAVLFHRNKDCTLARRLRERRNGLPTPEPVVPTSQRTVCTYFEEVPGIDPSSQHALLAMWTFKWKEQGWEARILGRKDAEQHPRFAELNARFEALPSVNPKGYDSACFRRYVAMAAVSGGLMVDYDVMPYGFRPEEQSSTFSGKFPLILADHNLCPCAMMGDGGQYEAAAAEFATRAHECLHQENGNPHVSDQSCVQAWKWPALDICYEMGREGWLTAKLVHYAHSCCGGRSRLDVIPASEKLRPASAPAPKIETNANFVHSFAHSFAALSKPATWIDGIRERVSFLKDESLQSDNNRTRIMQELKKSGLNVGGIKYGQKKKRRRQFAKA